jgi:translation initiation factor IF-2
MEQRRVRLGDIVDDYCPRERRLTNHAVVAMVGDDVKQTRCTTCDAEHPYKNAKVPPRRKKPAPAALFKPGAEPDAVEGETDQDDLPLAAPAPRAEGAILRSPQPDPEPPVQRAGEAEPQAEEPAPAGEPAVEEGPVHRPLIRAQLPRVEGQVPTRQIPDFTLRLPGARLGPLRDQDRGHRNGRPGAHSGNVGRLPDKPQRAAGKPGRPGGKPGRGPRPGAPAHQAAPAHAPGGKPRGRRPRHGKKPQR